MRITEISIKLGATINLGDYNNSRPEVGARAVVEPFDDADEVFAELGAFLEERLAKMVDDDLERVGQEPRYDHNLYQVRYSELRGCVVVAAAGIELPKESDWKNKDSWTQVDTKLPYRMRYDTAQDAAIAYAKSTGMGLYYVHQAPDLDELPGLPDPGPEPSWSAKHLRSHLASLRIPEELWSELADLEFVDQEYLLLLYNYVDYRHAVEDRISIIRAGGTPWLEAKVVAEPDDEWDDDDDDDDDE